MIWQKSADKAGYLISSQGFRNMAPTRKVSDNQVISMLPFYFMALKITSSFIFSLDLWSLKATLKFSHLPPQIVVGEELQVAI